MQCPNCHHLNYPEATACARCQASLVPPAPVPKGASGDLAPGQVLLGRYEIVGELGRGAMGTVFRAEDRTLNRTVALKILAPELWQSSKARQRMAREATVLGRVVHPNVVGIHNVLEHGNALVLELELVAGGTLADRLDQGALPLEETLQLMLGILEGLAAIHDAGVVHRDLKPSNILMMEDGTPKLADLGVAHDMAAKGLTGTGATLGTVDYMSPEQIKGMTVGPATDIYACGVLLHQMVTRRLPYEADSDFEVMAAHLNQAPNLAELQAAAPPSLVHAVARSLAKEPDQRWKSARELAEVLQRLATRRVSSGVARTLDDDTAPAGLREQLRQLAERSRSSSASREGPDAVHDRDLASVSAGLGADTLFSSVSSRGGAQYGACLPVGVGLLFAAMIVIMVALGVVMLGVIQIRSGQRIPDLVEEGR